MRAESADYGENHDPQHTRCKLCIDMESLVRYLIQKSNAASILDRTSSKCAWRYQNPQLRLLIRRSPCPSGAAPHFVPIARARHLHGIHVAASHLSLTVALPDEE